MATWNSPPGTNPQEFHCDPACGITRHGPCGRFQGENDRYACLGCGHNSKCHMSLLYQQTWYPNRGHIWPQVAAAPEPSPVKVPLQAAAASVTIEVEVTCLACKRMESFAITGSDAKFARLVFEWADAIKHSPPVAVLTVPACKRCHP